MHISVLAVKIKKPRVKELYLSQCFETGSPLEKITCKCELTTLLIAIGAMALKKKCLNIASCANIIPPIGELKPAEIAAATPHPKMSFDNSLGTFLFMRFPIVPPRCTNGPYCPTDAPPLAEMKAKMLIKTSFSIQFISRTVCAQTTSAGPWYREIFNILYK